MGGFIHCIHGRVLLISQGHCFLDCWKQTSCILDFFVNQKSVLAALLWSFISTCRVVKYLSHPTGTSPEEVKQGSVLPSCFSSHAVNKCPLQGLSGTIFFASLCVLWWFCCFEWPLRIVLKCCLMFRSSGRLPSALWGKY